GEELQDAGLEFHPRVVAALHLGLLLQDAEAKLVVRRVQVDDEPALQAALDPFLQPLNFPGRAIGRNDYLTVLIDERVEGVKELLLRRILSGDELKIIDHEDIDAAKQFLEGDDLALSQGLDEAVHELLGRQVD